MEGLSEDAGFSPAYALCFFLKIGEFLLTGLPPAS